MDPKGRSRPMMWSVTLVAFDNLRGRMRHVDHSQRLTTDLPPLVTVATLVTLT